MATTIYDKSVFKKYFDSDDSEVIAWVDNVVNKLFQDGIVPKYIQRNQGNAQVDADYNAYWTMVATFLAYFVKLSRVFENFETNQYLASQYLLNLNSYINNADSITRLQYIISNRLRDLAKRGTQVMITPSSNINIPDGELLRLVGYQSGLDFFKLGLPRPQYSSWNVDNCGPTARGCTQRYDLNLGYEYSEDFVDQNLYPILNTSYTSIVNMFGKNVLRVTGAPLNTDAGIGLSDPTKVIHINANQNFEITFYIAQNVNYSNISFGIIAISADGSFTFCRKATDGSLTNFFFQNQALNNTNELYFVRGILYNSNQSLLSSSDAQLNIGFGSNLILPYDAIGVIPYIVVNNSVSTSGAIYLWNLKVTPCSTVYNKCFLDNKNFIDIFTTNRSGYTATKVKEILRRYFIPYNTAFDITFLDVIQEAYLSLESGSEGGGFFAQESSGDLIKLN